MHAFHRASSSDGLRAPAWLAIALLATWPAGAAAQMVFEPPVNTPLGATVNSYALGDLDGDGDADLVLPQASGAPWIRLGDGGGQFGAAVSVAQPGLMSQTVALADLDGDATLDLLVGSSVAAPPGLWVLLGTGDGSFGAPAAHALLPSGLFKSTLVIETGDADGDGDLDVTATTAPDAAATPGAGEVRLFLNDGSGALTTALVAPPLAPHSVRGAFPTDANGDGLPDLVVAAGILVDFFVVLHVHVLLGTPGGGFEPGQSFADEMAVALADLDADGRDELLTTLDGGAFVQLRPNDGNGHFLTGPVAPTGPDTAAVGFADFDGDGGLDLVATANFSVGDARFQHGAGLLGFSGPFVPLSTPASTLWQPRGADVDGDGRLDLVALLDNASAPKLGVARNRTYTADEPILDLGHPTPGGKGFPVQVAQGQFGAGDPFSFTLHGAPALGPVFHVVGLTQIFAPFKGGVLVPSPNLITGPWVAAANGKLVLAGLWPAGVPAGFTLTLQFWFADSAAAAGFAASSAVAVSL